MVYEVSEGIVFRVDSVSRRHKDDIHSKTNSFMRQHFNKLEN